MQITRTKKHFPLLGKLAQKSILAGVSILAFSHPVFAAAPGLYVPNLMIARQVSEADVFSEAMTNGQSEGVLIGKMARQLQLQLQVSTPVRMKVVKGDIDAAGCQIMYISMAVTGIQVPKLSPSGIDYVFTNKLTLCKDKDSPKADVIFCDFGGKSCMPVSGPKVK